MHGHVANFTVEWPRAKVAIRKRGMGLISRAGTPPSPADQF